MNMLQKCGAIALASLFFLTPALAEEAKKPAENPVVEHGWAKRCDAPKKSEEKGHCEVFQLLDTKEKSQRIAEFAIGTAEKKDKIAARGVAILPLGMLVEPGVAMKIGDDKPASFKIRYCTPGGCYGFINIDKSMIDSLKKSKSVSFQFKSVDGQNVNIVMNLNGFEKALKEIQ